MKNALVIAAREFEEKRFIAYAAVAFAVLPFILGAIPGVNGKSPNDTIAMSSLIFATGFAVALAVMSGASFIGRDLSDGRMSFYFSRPVAPASIWFGKLMAGTLMVLGVFVLIIGPAWLVTGKAWKSFWGITLGQGIAIVLVVALSLFLIAHVIGTFARSRSALIAADFAAAVLCGVSVRYLVLPLIAGQALIIIKWLLISLGVALVLAILGGGAWQLERGRTDRKRHHLALSQFLWGTMALALLIAAGYVGWVVSAKPADITGEMVTLHSPGGPFLTVAGKARSRADYNAAWLMNTEDGRNIRIDSRSAWGMQYTRDGRSAFWPVVEGNLAELRRYTAGAAEPVDTGLNVWGGFIMISDDGSRIAVVDRGILSIHDVKQKRLLMSARVPQLRSARGCFLSPDRFRLYAQTDAGLQIFEFDMTSHSLVPTGEITGAPFLHLSLDPTASRMVVRAGRSSVVTLNDARTGAVIRTLASGPNLATSRYLRDGRIIVVDTPENAPVLHLFAADGSPIRDIALGRGNYTGFAGDDGTRVILMTSRPGTLVAINLDRGVIERQESGANEWIGSNWYEVRPPIGPLREVVYRDSEKHVVAWNPATGAKRKIA